MIPHRVFLVYIMTTATMHSVKLTLVRKPPERIPGILIYAAYLWLTTLAVQIFQVRNFGASKNTIKILYPKYLLYNLKKKWMCMYVCMNVCMCVCVYVPVCACICTYILLFGKLYRSVYEIFTEFYTQILILHLVLIYFSLLNFSHK